MNLVCRVALAAAILVAGMPAAAAPRQQPAGRQTPQATPDQEKQKAEEEAKRKAEEEQKRKAEEPPKYEETVVVSGSRTEGKLINSPVTMTVIEADTPVSE